MDINCEELAYWYLRLNGFLTIRALVIHPDWGKNQGTDIDILGVRFHHRAENLERPMPDAKPFTSVDKTFVAITEVKKGEMCLNESWLDTEKPNLHRVMRFLGVLPTAETEGAANALATAGVFSNENYHISLVSIGGWTNPGGGNIPKGVPLITWDQILGFIYIRFRDYRNQKASHKGQWDDLANRLWVMREHYHRGNDMAGFIAEVKAQLVEG